MKESFFVFTQARLNSQRVPRKMVKEFCGTNLWRLACSKLEKLAVSYDKKWVACYDQELKDIAKPYNINIFNRTEGSANAETDVKLIWEICQSAPYEYYIMFNPCAPLLKIQTIERFISEFLQSPHHSMFGVMPVKNYFWNENGELFHPPNTKMFNTKLCQTTYTAVHLMYAGRTLDINQGIQLGDFTKNNPVLFIMDDKIECLDIDDPSDWDIASAVYNYYLDADYVNR